MWERGVCEEGEVREKEKRKKKEKKKGGFVCPEGCHQYPNPVILAFCMA